jgi:hypothetical protein
VVVERGVEISQFAALAMLKNEGRTDINSDRFVNVIRILFDGDLSYFGQLFIIINDLDIEDIDISPYSVIALNSVLMVIY